MVLATFSRASIAAAVEEACGANRPLVLRRPFGDAPCFAESELLGALLDASARYRLGGAAASGPTPRVFIDGGLRTVDLDALLPSDDDSSFDTYDVRMQAATRGGDYQIYLPDGVHRADVGVWRRIRSFADEVSRRVGFAPASLTFESFIGRYRQTASGIHRDTSDNFSFVVRGHKRMLFWPAEAFSHVATRNFHHEQIGRTAGRADVESALELEAFPGDIIYWPKTYWHTAVGAGDFVATANLAVWTPRPATGSVLGTPPARSALSRLPGRRVPYEPECEEATPPPDAMLISEAAATALADPHHSEALADRWLASLSAGGFAVYPDPSPAITPLPTRLRAHPETPPMMRRAPNERLVVAANGHLFTADKAPAVVASVVERLRAGATISLDEARRGASEEEATALSSLATFLWTNHALVPAP